MPRILRDDPFLRRRNPDEPSLAVSRGHNAAVLATCMLISVGLLALSRLDHSLVRAGRGVLAEAGAPLLAAVMTPFQPVQSGVRTLTGLLDVQREATTLREENQRLKGWEARAKELERRMQQLEEVARVVPEQRMTFSTARVIADTGGPFARVALLDAGRENGFKNGFPVINVNGLVGRIASSGKRSSRLLMLNDLNSRVPVYIGANSVRAIMLGDNGPLPKLAHLAADARVEPGDDVVTSGVGGVFPRGLRIGTVVDTGNQLRVELLARLDRLEYVSVLFFDNPGNAFADDELIAAPRSNRRRGAQTPVAPAGGSITQ